jgi:hypothetical protein
MGGPIDPLDSLQFNAVDYINDAFGDETSLDQVCERERERERKRERKRERGGNPTPALEGGQS